MLQLVERTRLLPYHGHVDVQVGDWVTEKQVVAHLDYVPATMRRVNLAKDLVIDPEELQQAMLRGEGEFVRRGEALAASYLLGERICSVAPIDGYVGLISRRLGNAYLRQPIPLGISERIAIDVPQELGITDLRGVIKVKVGTRLLPGQPIATSVGLKQRVLVSPLYGQVTSIDDGIVVLEPLQVKPELSAYLRGEVTGVLPRQGVVIRASAEVVQGQYGVGGEQGGEILVAAEPAEQLGLSGVTADWQGKVVVAGRTADLALLQAAAEVGCSALVVGHLSFSTLSAYLGEMATPGLTGNEDIKLTIILTERFTRADMQRQTWTALQQLNGRYATVDGTTHIRAGVIRPEIVICSGASLEPGAVETLMARDLQIGEQVRIVRQPWRDQSGCIVDLPRERQRLLTGSEVQVAVVAIADQQVIVPLSNLTRCRGE